MAPLLRYDVFISYAEEDLGFVRELVAVLEENGLQPFWAEGSIQPGDDWIAQLEKGLSRELTGIVVLSPDALKSKWAQRERNVLLNSDPLIIPLMFRNCEPSPFIGLYQMIDFRDPDKWDDSFAALVSRLRPNGAEQTPGEGGRLPERWPVPLRKLFAAFFRAFFRVFGKILQAPRAWRVSLRRLLAACLLVSVGSVLLASLLVSGWRTYHFKKLRDLQREVQAIDKGLSGIRPQFDPELGSAEYFDDLGIIQGSDIWQKDQRVLRRLFSRGRLVAQDTFIYLPSEKVPIRKVRSYLNENRSVFLVDEFAQDGILIEKRECPEGPERPCDVYIDDMRSPMPPPSLFLYR